MEFLSSPDIRVQSLKNLYQSHGLEVDVLRLDQIHPLVSGNKWFKLKAYVQQAKERNKTTLLTFGGAFSNHILATAAASAALGFSSIGIIRGERSQQLSTTLQEAAALQMKLLFVSRETYKQKQIPAEVWEHCTEQDVQIINEGGYGILGTEGVESIAAYYDHHAYTHFITAVGTGTTLAGFVKQSLPKQKVMGISVLKNAVSLTEEINALLPPFIQNNYTILHDYHWGGYAKATPDLFQFMNQWYAATQIPLDFVYTGKAFYAADQLIKANYFPAGSRILLIHTGGLQGNRSLPKDTLIF